MTQKRLLPIFCLTVLSLFGVSVVTGQTKSPCKNLLTAKNTPVYDTIAGIGLDINAASPQALHGHVEISIIAPGGSNLPYIYQISYLPDPGFIGVDTFVLEYRYANVHPFLTYQAFRVSVMPSLIKTTPDFSVVSSGSSVLIDPVANDEAQIGPLTLIAIPLVNSGTAVIQNNHEMLFTPEPGFLGIAQLNYVVCDPQFTCRTGSVSIGVNNGLPDVTPLQVFTNRNTALSIPLTYSGYTVQQLPANGNLEILQGKAFRYTPNNGFSGNDQFVLKTIVNGQAYLKNVQVKVYPVAPANAMAMDDLVYTPQGTPITFNVRQNDIGSLLVRNWSTPVGFPGTLSGTSTGGDVTFTPSPGFSGVATFQYKIGNPSAPNLETATVNVVVNNLAPAQYFPYLLTVPKETPLVLRYDIPYQDFSFQIIDPTKQGSLDYYPGYSVQIINGEQVSGNNMLIYTPDPGYTGTDNFALLYCAPNGQCQTTKIRMVVSEVSNPNGGCVESCVWPGDVDNSGLVDSKDLLPLGFLMGEYGPARADLDMDWYGHSANAWNNPFHDLPADLKYADSDGNGTVNASDVEGIRSRYFLANDLIVPGVKTGKGLPFFLDILTEDPEFGLPIQIEISLGNSNYPAIDVYGFTLDFALGPNLADSAFQMNFYENSWLTMNSPYIELAERPMTGRFEMGFSRTNGTPVSGEGVIGQVGFVIINIIEGGDQNNRQTLTINPTIQMADGSTTQADPITLELNIKATDRFKPGGATTGDFTLAAFPNPANDIIQVSWNSSIAADVLTLSDMQGRIVRQLNAPAGTQAALQVQDLPAGVYLVKVQTAAGIAVKKVQVLR